MVWEVTPRVTRRKVPWSRFMALCWHGLMRDKLAWIDRVSYPRTSLGVEMSGLVDDILGRSCAAWETKVCEQWGHSGDGLHVRHAQEHPEDLHLHQCGLAPKQEFLIIMLPWMQAQSESSLFIPSYSGSNTLTWSGAIGDHYINNQYNYYITDNIW